MKTTDVKIAVIDSGLEKHNKNINYKNISFGWTAFGDFFDYTGHGTNITCLIQKLSPDANIIIVKIYDKQLVTSDYNLISAIEWCIKNEIKIINLSTSVICFENYYEIEKSCREAIRQGIIIVASAENFGKACIPAYLSNVVGVGGAWLDSADDLYYLKKSNINFYGKILNENYSEIVQGNYIWGTSYATANVTGIISRIITCKSNFNEVVQMLKKISKDSEQIKYLKNEEFDFSANTKELSVPNIDISRGGSYEVVSCNTTFEKFIYQMYIERLRFPIKQVIKENDKKILGSINKKILSLNKYDEIDLYNIKKAIKGVGTKHIFRNKIPVIAVINISKFQSLSMYVQNYIMAYTEEVNIVTKTIAKNNRELLFEGVEYSYGNMMRNLKENEKYILTKILIDSIYHRYSNCSLILFEMIGEIYTEHYSEEAILNNIILCGMESDIIVIGDVYEKIECINKKINCIYPKNAIYSILATQADIENLVKTKKICMSLKYESYSINQLDRLCDELLKKIT